MKKWILIVITLLLALGLYAHPASTVSLSYDAKTMLLTVKFDHTVKNPADHFISDVQIKVAGKELINQELLIQDTAAAGEVVYKLSGIKSGTTIEALTTCNKTGKKSAKTTIK